MVQVIFHEHSLQIRLKGCMKGMLEMDLSGYWTLGLPASPVWPTPSHIGYIWFQTFKACSLFSEASLELCTYIPTLPPDSSGFCGFVVFVESMCLHMCADAWGGQRSILGVFLNCLPPNFQDRVCRWTWSPLISICWLTSEPQECDYLSPPQHWDYRCSPASVLRTLGPCTRVASILFIESSHTHPSFSLLLSPAFETEFLCVVLTVLELTI